MRAEHIRISGVTVTGIGATDGGKDLLSCIGSLYDFGNEFRGRENCYFECGDRSFRFDKCAIQLDRQCLVRGRRGKLARAATPTPTPTPTPGGGGELLVNGGFEGSASPWVASGTGFSISHNGNYPHGGTGYVYFGVNNSISGQAINKLRFRRRATGTLSFWLNMTSSETTTTTQYDKLFVEVRNTSGTLLTTLATYSNLNKTTAGVYSQKSFNVSAYKGQTVRIQFRSTTDSSVTTTFRVDDVSLK